MERRFPINHSRGQLREVEAETRRRQWLPFFQSVWVCHAAGDQLITDQFVCTVVNQKMSLTVQDCVYYLHFSL